MGMVNVLKFRTLYSIFLGFIQFILKIVSVMANSIDPDQTVHS